MIIKDEKQVITVPADEYFNSVFNFRTAVLSLLYPLCLGLVVIALGLFNGIKSLLPFFIGTALIVVCLFLFKRRFCEYKEYKKFNMPINNPLSPDLYDDCLSKSRKKFIGTLLPGIAVLLAVLFLFVSFSEDVLKSSFLTGGFIMACIYGFCVIIIGISIFVIDIKLLKQYKSHD